MSEAFTMRLVELVNSQFVHLSFGFNSKVEVSVSLVVK